MSLGSRVRKTRQLRGLTQKELAGNRLSKSMISQIENDRVAPSLDTLEYLAERLGMPVAALLDDTAI
ncbi:helix-turn-helix domain-containing protein [Limnochorda pilosa]|uniref:DNA-binding protein n=1 Tax=Limnochorda pilosa TaxID=1555112 RepID=A0A0K2SGW7_LIMPI|nr:DNA-binding protein [Limnochorda pilosa]